MSTADAYLKMAEEVGEDVASVIADYVGAVSDDVYRSVLAKVKAALGA